MAGEEDASDAVLQEVSDDARTEAAAPENERAEDATVDGDDEDHLPALIGVCESEDDALDESTGGGAFCDGGELALEIATEDGLLTDAGGEGDEEIDGDLGEQCGGAVVSRLR